MNYHSEKAHFIRLSALKVPYMSDNMSIYESLLLVFLNWVI